MLLQPKQSSYTFRSVWSGERRKNPLDGTFVLLYSMKVFLNYALDVEEWLTSRCTRGDEPQYAI
jgi:hypothetical protein